MIRLLISVARVLGSQSGTSQWYPHYARHVSRAQHVCISWNEGVCVEYYGTLKPCGPDVRC